MKVRIIEPGWAGYTGPVAGIHFEDGVSVEIDGRQAFQIASILRAEGTEDEDIVAAANEQMARVVEAVSQDCEVGVDVPKVDGVEQAPVVPAGFYSREDLERIADASGISGIREIADPLGVKGTSIVKLIDGILARGEKE